MEETNETSVQAQANSLTAATEWLEYEMALIKCIRDEHPIIYKNVDDITGSQRNKMVKHAWERIEEKLKHYRFKNHQTTWRNICIYYVNKYLRPKHKHAESELIKLLDGPKNKFTDGTLDFLNEEYAKAESKGKCFYKKRFFIRDHFEKNTLTNQPGTSKSDGSSNEDVINLSHEEIDSQMDVALEGNASAVEMFDSQTDKKKWNEDELLNATHLTQEMILELIRMKSDTQ